MVLLYTIFVGRRSTPSHHENLAIYPIEISFTLNERMIVYDDTHDCQGQGPPEARNQEAEEAELVLRELAAYASSFAMGGGIVEV